MFCAQEPQRSAGRWGRWARSRTARALPRRAKVGKREGWRAVWANVRRPDAPPGCAGSLAQLAVSCAECEGRAARAPSCHAHGAAQGRTLGFWRQTSVKNACLQEENARLHARNACLNAENACLRERNVKRLPECIKRSSARKKRLSGGCSGRTEPGKGRPTDPRTPTDGDERR